MQCPKHKYPQNVKVEETNIPSNTDNKSNMECSREMDEVETKRMRATGERNNGFVSHKGRKRVKAGEDTERLAPKLEKVRFRLYFKKYKQMK